MSFRITSRRVGGRWRIVPDRSPDGRQSLVAHIAPRAQPDRPFLVELARRLKADEIAKGPDAAA